MLAVCHHSLNLPKPPRARSRATWLPPSAGVAVLFMIGFAGCRGKEVLPKTKPTAHRSSVVARRAPRIPLPAANDSGSPANVASKCDDVCALSARLRCKNAAECKPRCHSMESMPVCQGEISAFFRCLVQQPLKNWECDPDGMGAIRDPYCADEQARVVACVEASAGG